MDKGKYAARDTIDDSPMTYNETVQAVAELVEVGIHTILRVRGVYPAEAFTRRQKYNVPVYQCRHPGLCEYIGTSVRAVAHELEESVVIALYPEGSTDVQDAVERFVFELDFVLPHTDKRNRNLVIKDNLSFARVNLIARTFMLKLLSLESVLQPIAGQHELTFRVLLNMRDEAVPSASTPDDPENGPWVPADGAVFPASGDHGTASAMARVTNSGQGPGSLPVMHPIYSLDSGVINMMLYAEERPEHKRRPIPTGHTSVTTMSTPSAPVSHHRDLDDPMIQDAASQSAGPLRQRRLYAQPEGSTGGVSDASNEASASDAPSPGEDV